MDLYIDFDGVLVDTISVSYKMIEDLGIDLNDFKKVCEFYSKLDWNYLLTISPELSNAFYYIDIICREHIFNPKILTTVNSLDEMYAKINYIRERNSNISIIFVPSGIDKSKVVKASDSILVDDFSKNLFSWKNEGGIGIKFAKEKSLEFVTINSLDVFVKKNMVKKLVKKI